MESILPEKIILREARPSDNEELIKLASASPMKHRVGSVYIDRSPDFFALDRARGGEVRTIVADLGGRPVGYQSYTIFEARVAGKLIRVASGHDFRVAPDLRRPWVAIKIMAESFRRAAEDGCDYIYGLAAVGNFRALPFSKGGPGWPKLSRSGYFSNFSIRPRRRPPRTRYRIGPAREEDIPEIVELINTHYRDHNLAPNFTPETFRASLSACPDYDIGDLFVARDRQGLAAVLGLWDQGRTKKIVILELHPALAVLFKIAALVVRLLHIPVEIPRMGVPVSNLYIRHAAVREGRKDAFRDLVRWVSAYNRRRTGERRLIFAAAHERDTSLWRRSMLRLGSKFHFFYHAFRPVTEAEAEALASRPFYDDFSLS